MSALIPPDILSAAAAQLAKDCGCSSDDFTRQHNICTKIPPPEDRMSCHSRTPFLMISFGRSVVAAAADDLLPQAQRLLSEERVPWMFFQADCTALILSWAGLDQREYSSLGSCFLPSERLMSEKYDMPMQKRVHILAPSEYDGMYIPAWSNALSLHRPQLDVLVAAIFDSGRPVAVAGCSQESDAMWQIGIDVLSEFRGRGYGSALTREIAKETLRRGAVPFYTAASANIPSLRTAAAAGFDLAWCEFSVTVKS